MESNEGELPDPYKKSTDEEKLQARKVMQATAAEKVAGVNTGYIGLKILPSFSGDLVNLRGASGLAGIDKYGE